MILFLKGHEGSNTQSFLILKIAFSKAALFSNITCANCTFDEVHFITQVCFQIFVQSKAIAGGVSDFETFTPFTCYKKIEYIRLPTLKSVFLFWVDNNESINKVV